MYPYGQGQGAIFGNTMPRERVGFSVSQMPQFIRPDVTISTATTSQNEARSYVNLERPEISTRCQQIWPTMENFAAADPLTGVLFW